MSRSVAHDGLGLLLIRFTYDPRLVGAVKSLANRRWNPADKHWTVPDDDVVAVVNLLHREGFRMDAAVCRLYRERGGAMPIEATVVAVSSAGGRGLFDDNVAATHSGAAATSSVAPQGTTSDLTVSELNLRVQRVLETAFPSPVWLVGEISGFNKSAHKKHVTFQLVERGEDGKDVSQVGATLFEGVRREIERTLADAGDPFRLEDEITVRVLARVELYVPWGSYRLVIEALDPAYTLGEAARRREEIVRRLTAEGILERNRSLPFPALPLRVALVTSLGSDAYNDVLRTLRESGFAFHMTIHGARVQGRKTEPSVLNAFDWFRARATDFDVLLVCRGGGSRSDLAWFDSEPLARAVLDFPLPVLVGIGHEQDVSVLDAVARRAKTPTAAAQMLVDQVARTQQAVEDFAAEILAAAGYALRDAGLHGRDRARRLGLAVRALLEREQVVLDGNRARAGRAVKTLLSSVSSSLARSATAIPRAAARLLEGQSVLVDTALQRLRQATRRDLGLAAERLTDVARRFGPGTLRRTRHESERTEARARRLELVDPRRVVERGYAILRRQNGAILRDEAEAPEGTRVDAELKRGSVRLRSEGPLPS